MVAALGLALLLSTTPVKVAVPAPSVAGIDAAVADAYTAHFVTLLGRDHALKLITQSDIAQTLGLERQKVLLGCASEKNSCLAELAGALGVDAILSISLAKTGTSFTATLRVLNARDSTELASATDRLKSEDALQDWLEAQAPDLAARVVARFNPTTTTTRPRARVLPWIALGGSALIAAGGGVLFGLSRANADQLRSGVVESADTAHSLATNGRTLEGVGLGLMIGGGVALAASAAWVALAPRTEVQVVIVPTPQGGAAMVGCTF